MDEAKHSGEDQQINEVKVYTLPVKEQEEKISESNLAINPKSGKKKFVLAGILAILVVVGLSLAIPYYQRYNAAKTALSDIDQLIQGKNYAQAYTDLKKFKHDNTIDKFSMLANSKIKQLADISDQQYREGLKRLNTDDSTDFNQTANFFKNYKIDFPYSQSLDQVDALLGLINTYNDKQQQLNEAEKLKTFLNVNGNVLSVMENYIQDVNKIHILADQAINQQNQDALLALVSVWDAKKSYYYAMVNDIDSVKDKDLNALLFSKEEYEQFENFVLNGLVPAEAAYNFYLGNYGYSDTDKVRASWSAYNSLQPRVNQLIGQKKDLINTAFNRIDSLEQEIVKLRNQIENYNSHPSVGDTTKV